MDPTKGTSKSQFSRAEVEHKRPTDAKADRIAQSAVSIDSGFNSKAEGFLAIRENRLIVTKDYQLAKASQAEIRAFLASPEGRINSVMLNQLQMRFLDEQLTLAKSSSPSGASQLLQSQLQAHGFFAAVETLDQMQQEKVESGKRYADVAPWPSESKDQFLHVLPNVHPPVARPSPTTQLEGQQSVVLNMMEPSLEGSIHIGDQTFSNAEFLVMSRSEVENLVAGLSDDDQERILADKDALDNYYRNTLSFDHSAGGKQFVITEPTTRYFPKQFTAIARSDRPRMVAQVEKKKEAAAERFVETGPSGAKTMASHVPEAINAAQAEEIVAEVEGQINPSLVAQNDPEIAGIHDMLRDLPPDSFIGQNAIDASSDSRYMHLQGVVDAPCDLIPAFVAPSENKLSVTYQDGNGNEQLIRLSRLRPDSYPGSIYKITTSANDENTRAFLEKVQNAFIGEENNGSSLNLVGRKLPDGSFEYYFILRKSIAAHPHLQQQMVDRGITRPGFAEMIGIRIAKNQAFFDNVPDDEYEHMLGTFGVEAKECNAFEKIVADGMRTFGPTRHNVLEASLRGLRSDAETSEMVHCVHLTDGPDHAAVALMANAPDDMKPNIIVCPENAQGLNFAQLAGMVAEKMHVRAVDGKAFGVVAVDEKTLIQLPEFQRLLLDLEGIKQQYSQNTNDSFKAFLLNHYEGPMAEFLTLFSDQTLDLLLKEPIPTEDFRIHEALMKRALVEYKALDDGSHPLNVRYEEYAYGMTNLVDDLPSPEAFQKAEDHALELGGTKFNSASAKGAQEESQEAFLKEELLPLIRDLAHGVEDREEIFEKIADLLFNAYSPKSTDRVDKMMAKLDSWQKKWAEQGRIDRALPLPFLEAIRENCIVSVGSAMLPVVAGGSEAYSLEQLSLTPDQLPQAFQSNGKIMPCAFQSQRTPEGIEVASAEALRLPAMPTGKKIAIVMNGGQAPGVADVAIGAILAAGPENDVEIFVHGNQGLLNNEKVSATIDDIPMIQAQGGFPGGTTRLALKDPDTIAAVQEQLQEYDGVVFIGGDGSFRHNKDLFLSAGVPVYFCIKTIDGDFIPEGIDDVDLTLGFYTAVEGYGDMIENRKAQAAENEEVHFLQVGGRFAGYLAVGTSALLPESARPTLSIYPEEISQNGWSLKDVVGHCAKACALRAVSGKNHGVFSVAEGVIQSFPEVKLLIAHIRSLKDSDPDLFSKPDFKAIIRASLPTDTPDGQYSLSDVLDALSDEDLRQFANPDAIGRLPVAKIDSYALLGRLVANQLDNWKSDASALAEVDEPTEQDIFSTEPLKLTKAQIATFTASKTPRMRGAKSNYDQRARGSQRRDYNNGLTQGMSATSAIFSNLSLSGQQAAIMGSHSDSGDPFAISTTVKAGGEEIAPDHPFVQARNAHLQEDLLR